MANFFACIGPVTVELVGSGKLFTMICEELEARPKTDLIEKPDLSLYLFTEKNIDYKPEFFSAKGNLHFDKECFFNAQPIPCLACNLFSEDKQAIVYIYEHQTSLFRKLMEVRASWSRLNAESASIMSYALFWYLFQLVLLPKAHSFIHGGTVAKNGLATILAGTGGCGKTSTLFKLMESGAYQYLSEDYGIISEDGKTYYNPKSISIYASDTRNSQTVLLDYIRRLKWTQKFKWFTSQKILGRNPMIKAPVADVLNRNLLQTNGISTGNVVYLIRADMPHLKSAEISSQDLARRLTNVALREFKHMGEILRLIKANAPVEWPYPSETRLFEQTFHIYEKAFAQVRRNIVYVPYKTSPAIVADFLMAHDLV